MNEYFFYANIQKGTNFKNVVEVLATVFTHRTNFSIRSTGIYHRNTDEVEHVLLDVELPIEKFLVYHHTEDLDFTVNIKNLNKRLKTKMKDVIYLYIYKNRPNKLYVEVETRQQTSSKKKDDMGSKDGEIPISERIVEDISIIKDYVELGLPEVAKDEKTGEEIDVYDYPAVRKSQDILRIKRLKDVHQQFGVRIKGQYLVSFFGDPSMSEVSVNLGADNTKDKKSRDYSAMFAKSRISTLIKLPPLSTLIQFWPPAVRGYPLKIGGDVGTLGTIKIYIKDLGIVEYEESLKRE